MKASELRELSVEELAAKSRELRDELFNAQVKRSTGQLENTAVVASLKRDVARAETILGEKREAKS